MAKRLFLGIDLGTTNSAAAIFDGTTVTQVRTPQGQSLTPSVVRIDGRGQVTAGAKARRMLEMDPENTRSEFKRLMGSGQDIAFKALGETRKPEQLAAEILRSLRNDVQDQVGVAPSLAVICVPALFELPQAAATSEAARLAGFERVELLQEPIASALAAGWSSDDVDETWMVYDLGGGTFDVSLLETRDGLLRVIGHDGDNFLGGRDLDHALLDEVLRRISDAEGTKLSRSDAALAGALRPLKLAVEDAKIELSRVAFASVLVPGLKLGDLVVDVDVELTLDDVTRLCAPLVDRSIAVCQRLLARHGLQPAQVARLVLVGGPTMMPMLRQRLREGLGVPLREGLDPMMLVAQGAALYAANARLDMTPPVQTTQPTGARVWLQYPAMSSDLAPHVVGRFVESEVARPARLRLRRNDGWQSAFVQPGVDGGFVVSVELKPRQENTFTLHGEDAAGQPVAVHPPEFSIVQGVALRDPPLSRTLGVALAEDTVRVYFERGVPLPAKRTFRHETVEPIYPGDAHSVLKIPIVQGEFNTAHLCRLVGALEIRGDRVQRAIPLGSPVELTLELDRGGRLLARALVVATGELFEDVAHLSVPSARPEDLHKSLLDVTTRLSSLKTQLFRHGMRREIEWAGRLDAQLAEVENDIAAASAGDADCGQRAQRALIDLDGELSELDAVTKLPELAADAEDWLVTAHRWVGEYGTAQEKRLLEDSSVALQAAIQNRQVLELQRRVRHVRGLADAAYQRDPQAWHWEFAHAASRVDEATDLPAARRLVDDGRQAAQKNDLARLKQLTVELRRLLPAEASVRRLGHDSGLR